MKIDWDWGNPPKHSPLLRLRAWRWFVGKLCRGGVPLHYSNHYVRSHFHDDGEPRLF